MSTDTLPRVTPSAPEEDLDRGHTLHEIWLVIRRELVSTMATRGYVLGTIVMVAVLGVFVFVQAPAGAQGSTIEVVADADRAAVIQDELRDAFSASDVQVEVRSGADAAAATEAVRAGDLDAAVTTAPNGRLQAVVLNQLDAELDEALRDVVRERAIDTVLAENGLDPGAVDAAATAQALEVIELEPLSAEASLRLSMGLIACILIYLSLLLYGVGLAQSVVEEKSSRVVEILLSTIRPWQLLIGKVVGAGISGLVQLGLLAGFGLVGAAVSGSLQLPASVLTTVAWAFVWYVLGFLLFATLIAAAASTVSRQEEVSAVFQPMVLFMGAPFLTGILLAGNDPEGTPFEVLSMVPVFSPIMMPIRVGLGTVPLWQSLLALVLTGLTIAVVALGAGRVYANSVLRSGGRVRLAAALGRNR